MNRHLCLILLATAPWLSAVTPDHMLNNGTIKVGTSDDYGAAIVWVSAANATTNMVNNFDQGRQIQQSYYAGDSLDRTSEGQHPTWTPWPWNPVQAGDGYGNRSTVLAHTSTASQIYSRTRPKLWDMDNENSQCEMEQWITFASADTVQVVNRLTCARTDNRWDVLVRPQEIPAIYCVVAYNRLRTYSGENPWINDGLSTIPNTFPWSSFNSHEGWAACVNSSNYGIGLITPDQTSMKGGRYLSGSGGEMSATTMHFGARITAALERTSAVTWTYYLTVGNTTAIRNKAYTYRQSAFNGGMEWPEGSRPRYWTSSGPSGVTVSHTRPQSGMYSGSAYGRVSCGAASGSLQHVMSPRAIGSGTSRILSVDARLRGTTSSHLIKVYEYDDTVLLRTTTLPAVTSSLGSWYSYAARVGAADARITLGDDTRRIAIRIQGTASTSLNSNTLDVDEVSLKLN